MKLILALMCVGLGAGTLAGCTNSTMPSPDDPSTAIHEDPVASQGSSQSNATVATAQTPHKILAESATAAK